MRSKLGIWKEAAQSFRIWARMFFGLMVGALSSFPMAAVTNYGKLGDLINHTFILLTLLKARM